MTAATDTVLDQQTRDELQPQCEISCTCSGAHCHAEPRDADWIATVTVGANHAHTLLLCDGHLCAARATARCAPAVTITAEPLR